MALRSGLHKHHRIFCVLSRTARFKLQSLYLRNTTSAPGSAGQKRTLRNCQSSTKKLKPPPRTDRLSSNLLTTLIEDGMKTKLVSSAVSDIQSECLVAIVLDHNTDKNKDAKPDAKLASTDSGFTEALADVIASGDVTGKSLETVLLHGPKGLKSKRLLLVGGGKAAKFSADDIRKIAGTAVRYAKTKNLKSLAISIPDSSISAADAARAIVEGAFVGDFDPNYYAS